MNQKSYIKAIPSMLPVLGLALLLLLSPCRVRNFIQEKLGLPQTEVVNKSITTVQNASCHSLEITENASTVATSSYHHSPFIAEKKLEFSFSSIGFIAKLAHFYATSNRSISVVPLYILFQNIKVYL